MLDGEGREKHWVVFLHACSGAWIPRAMILPYTPEAANNAQEESENPAAFLWMTAGDKTALKGAFEEGQDRHAESLRLDDDGVGQGENAIEEGDIVIAQHGGFPPWPCVVVRAGGKAATKRSETSGKTPSSITAASSVRMVCTTG